ncbi:hypothetical protein PsorP6_012110 [Peronosclerospora sorghi]|uniref:Uncharacterized protein n=1 Tax=Peronosclerospora sorghi TaxID=230839 RepID=A0ACC0WIR5_9STRA|nr:hypothetical protein PsorP6_012110 [Peronosclerospora sorghi]
MARPETLSPALLPLSPVPLPLTTGSETCSSPLWEDYLAPTSTISLDLATCSLPFDDLHMEDPPVPGTHLGMSSTAPTPSSMDTAVPPSSGVSHRRLRPAPLKLTSKPRAASVVAPVCMSSTIKSALPTLESAHHLKTFSRPELKITTTSVAYSPSRTQVGRWTKKEHELFLEGLERFGKSWKKIGSLVHTRTLVQIRTHAQKYLQKQSRAAIKADRKPAGTSAVLRACDSRHKTLVDQRYHAAGVDATCQSPFQLDAPKTGTHPWKSSPSGNRTNELIHPISFATSRASPRSAIQLNSVNRLDLLLLDDNHPLPAFLDEYYTSPTAIEDDLLLPLYAGDHWVHRFAPMGSAPPFSTKRRRHNELHPFPSTSSAIGLQALRPPFSSLPFEPLLTQVQPPDVLASPCAPSTVYGHQESPTAHESDDQATAWL